MSQMISKILLQIERWLILYIKLGAILVLSSQVLLIGQGMGERLNLTLHLEGIPMRENTLFDQSEIYSVGNVSYTPWNSITLELLEYPSRPDVELEINGLGVGNFLKKEISVNVKTGDLLSVFNPDKKYPANIKISKLTSNIIRPELGDTLTVVGRNFFTPIRVK